MSDQGQITFGDFNQFVSTMIVLDIIRLYFYVQDYKLLFSYMSDRNSQHKLIYSI